MRIELQRTVCSVWDYAHAFIRAWRDLYEEVPRKEQCGVLYAQWIVETGGKHCYNWNIGNVKVTQAQVDAGVPWFDLPGTWEIVGDGDEKKRVTLPDGHPGRRFRAFESLSGAMGEHLVFLRKRFSTCWPHVEAGEPTEFAHALKAGRDGIQGTWDDYFTGSVDDYARIMVSAHAMFMQSSAFDDALANLAHQSVREDPALTNPSVRQDPTQPQPQPQPQPAFDIVTQLPGRELGDEGDDDPVPDSNV